MWHRDLRDLEAIIVLLFFILFQEKWNKTKVQYALAAYTKEEEGMRHKLSKWLFAELKFTSISVLLLFYTMVRVLLSIPSVCDFDPLCLDLRGL